MKKSNSISFIAGIMLVAGAASASPAPKPSTPPPTVSDKSDMSDMSDMSSNANMDMMPIAMPQLPEIGTYTANGHEDWKALTGFGHNDAMVGMMNRMMIEGSGMGKMKPGAMNMTFDDKTFADDSAADTDQPAAPAAPAPIMPLSTPPPAPTANTLLPAVEPLTITAAIANPIVGDNRLSLTITDPAGAPITGAKMSISIAMVTMDMGTSHPLVKEAGAGTYTSTVEFTMAGPWRVMVKATPPGTGVPQAEAFNSTQNRAAARA